MNKRTCKVDECNTDVYAKDFCRIHYTRSRSRTPDKKVERQCVICGTSVMRNPRVGYKYGATCSNECRYKLTWGERCELPEDHWGRWYGKSSRIPTDHASRLLAKTPPLLRNTGSCGWCGKENTRNASARFCSRKCKERQGKATRRGREYNSIGEYSFAELVRLWVKFDKACAYCSTPTPLELIQAEHVVPLSRNGRNDMSNLLPSCGPCNSDKRDLLLGEWNGDRIRRGLLARSARWDETDQRYSHIVVPLVAVP